MSLTFAEEYTRIEEISKPSNNELIEDNEINTTNNLHSSTDNNSIFSYDENSCIDNNDNSLNVTGEQNLSHIHASNNIHNAGDNSSNGPQRHQQQKKALNLNGNEMRHRKNLLFNLINSIMNYLGTSNRNCDNKNKCNVMTNSCTRIDDDGDDVGSELIKKDYVDDTDRIIMNKFDRCSKNSGNNSCDNRNNNNNFDELNSDLNDKDEAIEYAFSDETDGGPLEMNDDQTEDAMVPKSDSFSVTLR